MPQEFFSIQVSTHAQEAHLIRPPLRSNSGGVAVVCAVVALLSAVMVFPHVIGSWVLAIQALFLIAALCSRSMQAIHISLFVLLWVALPFHFPVLRPWPLNLLAPVIVYGIIVAVVPSLRRSFGWLRRGRFEMDIVQLVLLTAVVSGVALVVWYAATRPDIRQHLKYLPSMPAWLYPLAGLTFAMGNASLEETIYRGIIMDALDSAFGPGSISIVLQALPFAILHYATGFPNDGWGFGMTFVYAIMLGAIRRRARGMFAPWLAHVCADITIFAILAWVVLL